MNAAKETIVNRIWTPVVCQMHWAWLIQTAKVPNYFKHVAHSEDVRTGKQSSTKCKVAKNICRQSVYNNSSELNMLIIFILLGN